jgi:trigger factor
LNISTEQLDNHAVRITVEIDAEAFETAKRDTLRTISGKVNIPGFRKGKAPASVISRYVGPAYILEETVESLGQKLYRQALESQNLEPAAPGSMDDFKLEPQPTFIYTVPLAPVVKLSDYRAIRLDYVEPTVGEEEVETELRGFQREFAETTVSDEAAAVGDKITCDLHSFFIEAEAETDSDADVHDRKEEPYVHRHGAVLFLTEGTEEPLAPGFTQNIVGAKAGETRTFRITFPEPHGKVNVELAGRTVEFVVTLEKVEKATLPAIDDALAAKISERFGWDVEAEGETKAEAAEGEQAEAADELPSTRPLTLEEVRGRLQTSITERSQQKAREDYANKVLQQVIDEAEVTFHDASVNLQIDDMVEDLKERLRDNRLDLDTYLRQTGRTIEEIRADYREPAAKFLRRSLVVSEFANIEKLSVSQDDLQARLMEIIGEIGPETLQQLGLLNDQRFVNNMANNIMSQKIEQRAIAIGKGEAPSLEAVEPVAPSTEATDSEDAAS